MPISTLLLDLDGTLYPNQNGIWDAIAQRMDLYMHEILKMDLAEIPKTRQQYYQKYGTTLRGLQENYHIDPLPYLAYVHDISMKDFLQPDPELNSILENLPQEKWIFTNSDQAHARRVLSALSIEHHFKGIIDIIKMEFNNKPNPLVYFKALSIAGSPSPNTCLFADDSLKNLMPADEQGIHTVLVGSAQNILNSHYHIQTIHELPLVIKAIEKKVNQ